ncbi:MAG TPA: DUF5916 domain-containing protein, partial [Bacteroidales bacterium]|nr:DUF5916 domain-containing protein [Bacteroidales bacterium]
NLSPYELYYDEKRQFFTEGTELFNRAGIFYSRRIGNGPKFSDRADDALKEHEDIHFMPSETQLVNATKISGRNTNGLGMGMLNAMSLASYATLKDTITGAERDVLVQPFTNYNVTVFDQSLKNNSYISLINTNVSMFHDPFSANVTATDFQLRDKSKKYALSGKAGLSVRGDSEKETGYGAFLKFEKNSGNLQFGVSQEVSSDKMNFNDLGYLRQNNFLLNKSYIYYQIIDPFWIFRECYADVWNNYTRMYTPGVFAKNESGIEMGALFKNNYRFNTEIGFVTDNHDYWEPRVENRYVLKPAHHFYTVNLRTDQRKSVSCFIEYGAFVQPSTTQYGNWGESEVNVRLGKRLQLAYALTFNNEFNDRGYVDKNDNEDSIHFAIRDILVLENILYTSYSFTNKASVSFRARHYWSGAENKEYFLLNVDGDLLADPSYHDNNDNNYNAFNIDMVFSLDLCSGLGVIARLEKLHL